MVNKSFLLNAVLLLILIFTAFSAQGGAIFGTKWGPDSTLGTPGGTVSWSLMGNEVTCSIEFASCRNTPLSIFAPNGYLSELLAAFNVWSEIADINFTQVPDGGEPFNSFPQSDIRLGGHAFDGKSKTLAHGFFPPPNGFGGAGDIHFDTAENWNIGGGVGKIDFRTIAIHEIGHAIGLNHSKVRGASMWATYTGADYTLSIDDVLTAQKIYGEAKVPEPKTILLFLTLIFLLILNFLLKKWQLFISPLPEQIYVYPLGRLQ